MAERPKIELGEWISIGQMEQHTGVISSIYKTRPDVIEIVHLNKSSSPFFEDVRWNGSFWDYTNTAVSPGYAKPHNRLKPYVEILLTGKQSHESLLELMEEED